MVQNVCCGVRNLANIGISLELYAQTEIDVNLAIYIILYTV